MALADRLRHLVEVDRDLGDEDHVGAAGDAAHHGDPAGVAAHHLDDHDAVVRLGRRVEPVDRLGRDRDRGVEAERVVGAGEVVVDRLRDADDRELALVVEARRDAERVLAADRDERVELAVGEVLYDALDGALELERVRAARADDRPAARQDPRDLRRAELLEDRLDEAAPALAHRDHVPAGRIGPAHDRADDRVEAGAVAAAGEDAEAFRHAVEPRWFGAANVELARNECRRWESNPHGPKATGFRVRRVCQFRHFGLPTP